MASESERSAANHAKLLEFLKPRPKKDGRPDSSLCHLIYLYREDLNSKKKSELGFAQKKLEMSKAICKTALDHVDWALTKPLEIESVSILFYLYFLSSDTKSLESHHKDLQKKELSRRFKQVKKFRLERLLRERCRLRRRLPRKQPANEELGSQHRAQERMIVSNETEDVQQPVEKENAGDRTQHYPQEGPSVESEDVQQHLSQKQPASEEDMKKKPVAQHHSQQETAAGTETAVLQQQSAQKQPEEENYVEDITAAQHQVHNDPVASVEIEDQPQRSAQNQPTEDETLPLPVEEKNLENKTRHQSQVDPAVETEDLHQQSAQKQPAEEEHVEDKTVPHHCENQSADEKYMEDANPAQEEPEATVETQKQSSEEKYMEEEVLPQYPAQKEPEAAAKT